MRSFASSVLILTLAATAAACGDDDGPPVGVTTPYEGIPAEVTVTITGLDGPIDIVRDSFGIPHVYATTMADLSFGNGYVQAADRLPQMQLFRHAAEGRVAELFGALAPEQIDDDIAMRMHRFLPLAQETVQMLAESTDPVDQEVHRFLVRYADGVNKYAEELAAGVHTLDSTIEGWFPPDKFAPWTPADTLSIGAFQAFSLSYDVGAELWLTERVQAAEAAFVSSAVDPEHARRAGAAYDLYPVRPMDTTATIDGWPNVGTDTGTRAKPAPSGRSDRSARRPVVPGELLRAAIRASQPHAALAKAMRHPDNGSNDWVVGPALAGGTTIVANDPHLSLLNPSVFYAIHLTVPDRLDVQGISFPGIPGVILGHNQHVAWGSTTAYHDVSDFYLEQIVPCAAGGGDCAVFNGGEVPLETFTETIIVGALGTQTDEITVTYERVPHHGPILPIIANNRPVPRTTSDAISVRYTAYEGLTEVKAVYLLDSATSRAEAFDALDHFNVGAQSWVIADDAGEYAWTTSSYVPLRSDGCYTFHAETAPDGVAPFFVVPGDGSCEWEGRMDARYVPHSINPAKGYLATANQDLIGETFDGDALNGPIGDDGYRLYVSAYDDPGYRAGRITRRLEALKAAGAPITMEDLESIQADAFSSHGDRMTPFIVVAAARFAAEIATPGTHPDLAAFVAAMPAARRTRVLDAAAYLQGWTFDTPAAIDAPTPTEVDDSVATTIFNTFMYFWIDGAVGDELAVTGFGFDSDNGARVTLAMLERPTELLSGVSLTSGDPVLCDDLTTAAVEETCDLILLSALDQGVLEATSLLGPDMTMWRWGNLHTVTIESLYPANELDVPTASEGGYPRHGDQFSVDSSSPGYHLGFTYGHGPAMRHVTQLTPGSAPKTHLAIPGGAIFDRRSPHYRDLFDQYWSKNEYFELPFVTDAIIQSAETRWRLQP